MPALRRRSRGGDDDDGDDGQEGGTVAGVDPNVPWALGDLLRDGPAPLAPRAPGDGDRLTVALVLGPGRTSPREAGIPPELLRALISEGVDVRAVTADEADEDALADDVVLAVGWPAAPAVLTAVGVRARAVLATTEPAPLAHLRWTQDIAVLGPSWMDGDLPLGVDAAYVPKPVHRREDLVLVHGEEPFGLLAAAELARRRDDLTFAVSGVRPDLALPFPFLGVAPGAPALAHAFASATVALAPPVRGWRPAALAMLACGQVVVAPDEPAARLALGEAASFAAGPLEAADAVEALFADLTLRAERARAGFAIATGGWSSTAAALAADLRAR